ncbi:MAG TPA: hypothetical protein VFV08_04190, partial [Puia sp.]|nr:hypothetical protein [Puia sp.]
KDEQLAEEIRSLRAELEYLQAMKIRDDMKQKVQALRTAQNDSVPTLENANVQRHQQRNEVQHQHNDERQNVNDARIPLNNVRNQNENRNINANQFDRQPMQLDRFRQLVFDGIPGYPNPIDKHLRLQVPKFLGNNTVSGEDHLKAFQNVMDNFEVEHEDVFMKSFMQSLIDEAREWYKNLPDRSISSWDDFKRMFKEQYGDKTDPSFFVNEFTSITKGSNEQVADFNARFTKVLNKLPHHMRPNEPMCIILYINAFDAKTAYGLRDKGPATLRDAFRIAVNIENNRKASGKTNRRDDVKILQNPNKPQNTQGSTSAPEDKIDKLANVVKDLSYRLARSEKGMGPDRQVYQRQEKRPSLHDMPYNTNWHDGKPIFPRNNTNQRAQHVKETPDPLKKAVNIVDDAPWCIICQMPHSQ